MDADAKRTCTGKTAAEELANDIDDLMIALLAAAGEGKDTSLLKGKLEEATERLNEVLNRAEGR
jgi:hypothetical protein